VRHRSAAQLPKTSFSLEFGPFGKKARKSPSPLPLSQREREKKQFGGWIVTLWCDNPTPKPLIKDVLKKAKLQGEDLKRNRRRFALTVPLHSCSPARGRG